MMVQPEVRRLLIAIFPGAAVYSGQTLAARHLIRAVLSAGWACEPLPTPVLNRDLGRATGVLEFALRLCTHIRRALDGNATGVFYINLGQTWTGLLREGITFLLRSKGGSAGPGVISLHGSWFMSWSPRSLKAAYLRKLTSIAGSIAVLGPNQRLKLVSLGVRKDAVFVIDNTTDMQPLPLGDIAAKHSAAERVELLFLSNLIDTKGYREYLDALCLLAERKLRFTATLCGEVTFVGYREGNARRCELEQEVSAKLCQIRSHGSEITWVRGASGEAKSRLMRAAHIFVLPSRLEAQPLCIVEAMAAGCAIISSKVGEIPDTIGSEAGMLLESVTPAEIAEAMATLIADSRLRTSMATAAAKRFSMRFSPDVHNAKWREALGGLFEARCKNISVV